jgi:signal transduction histidine kinase
MKLFDVLARQVADLIERRRAENGARKSEGRFRRTANTAPVIVWMNNTHKKDVSENRLAEEALATINQRLIAAQEEERARIARELHDDITQRLAMLNVSLAMLARSAPIVSSAAGRREIERVRKEVADLTEDVQALSHRLHPARLDYLGIAEAAEALCHEMSTQHGVEISFHGYVAPKDLSRPIVVCLYRVLQEALQNAISIVASGRSRCSFGAEANRWS